MGAESDTEQRDLIQRGDRQTTDKFSVINMDKFRGDQSFRVSSAQGGVSTERKSILIESKNLQDLRFMEETTE